MSAVIALAFLAGENRSLKSALEKFENSSSFSHLPLVDASAAVSSDKFSLATGLVSDDADGLFLLDHNSGLLQCQVIYPRTGQIMGLFTVNVADSIGTGGKGGDYLMLTGRADFPTSNNNPASPTVVYVMDTATGNYSAYGVPFNKSFVNSNRPQKGGLALVVTGSANPLIDRDRLR